MADHEPGSTAASGVSERKEASPSMDRRAFLRGSLAAGAGLVAAKNLSSSSTGALRRYSSRRIYRSTSTTTITLWTWAWPTEPYSSAFTNHFQRANPDITLQVKKFTAPDYLVALTSAMPNRTAGDLFHMTPGPLIREWADYLLPLDSYAKKAWGADWQSAFIGTSIQQMQESVPASMGTLAIPQEYSIGGVMWSNSVALKGISGGRVPQSYSELVALGKKLKAVNRCAVAWGAQDQWPNPDFLVQFSAAYKPGIVTDACNGTASFTDPAIVAGLEFMKRSLNDGIYNAAPFATTAFPGSYDLFNEGVAFSADCGTWYTGELYVAGEAQDMGAFLWPKLPDAPNDDWTAQLGLPSGIPEQSGPSPVRPWQDVNAALSIANHLPSDVTEAAWKFIEYFCGPIGQRLGAPVWVPARKGIKPGALSARWQKTYDWQTALAPGAQRRNLGYNAILTAVENACAAVCVQGADAKTALAKVQAVAEKARK